MAQPNHMRKSPKKIRSGDFFQSSRSIGSEGRWPIVGVCVFLAAVILAVFGQTLGYGFINYDDNGYVSENTQVIRGLTWKGIEWAFTHSVSANWHPLTVMSHMLDCQFYGLNAGGHHLTNVLLHTATAILLFLVLRQMMGLRPEKSIGATVPQAGAFWGGAFVAAVFAIHPLRVESVAWVSERKDVLSGLFFMLTIGAYVRYVQGRSRVESRESSARSGSLALDARPSALDYCLVLLFFALGLMSKPMLVTLPFVLLLLDYWPLGRFTKSAGGPEWFFIPRRLLLEKIPLLILAAAGCVATLLAQHEAIMKNEVMPFSLRITNALASYAVYLKQMFYPAKLAPLYPYPMNSVPVWESLIAFVFLVAVSAGVIAWRRKRPCLMVGWFWYLGMLVPVIGLVQVGTQAHADRYTYLPQIGLYVMVVWLVADLCATWRYRRVVLGGLMATAIAALMLCSRIQTTCWRDSELLWTHTLACTSNNAVAHNGLGDAYFRSGQMDEAIEQYQSALKVRPQYVLAIYNLGDVLLRLGRVDEAIEQYQKALALQPNYAEACNNLGNALAQKGRMDEAIVQFKRALEIRPAYAEGYSNLGNALVQEGRVDEAIACYQKALKIKPGPAQVYINLGSALLQKERMDEAMEQFQQAINLQPDSAQAHFNLSQIFLLKGQGNEAMTHLQEALKIRPDYAKAHDSLGVALMQKGQVDEALEHFKKAVEIEPGFATAHYHLGMVLAQKGRLDEATAQFKETLRLKPDDANAKEWLRRLGVPVPE